MSRKVLNNPSPDVLMNSMRSIGYSFKTAVADIIDNSISANATEVKIFSPINSNIFMAFLDNGYGMDRDELLNAMKYGSNRENYGMNDLGRFGLGLKSASLSQCKKLTVVSKKNNKINAFCWDLDCVLRTKTWECIELDFDEIKNLPKIDALDNLLQGTLVIWQDFDILYKKSNGLVLEAITEEMEETEKHLALVFHRFLTRKINPLNIYINEDKIVGLDPFLENNLKTYTPPPSFVKYKGYDIKIQQVNLPHYTDLDDKDIDKLGGDEMLRSGQGFYVYRNDRLIIYGTWFRLKSTSVNSELYKYGRIKVDIPNTLDEEWDIDIKKQNASIPRDLLVNLKSAVSNVTERSKDKTIKRNRLKLEKDDDKIWNKVIKDNKEVFFINCDSKFIKNFIDGFEDSDKSKIIRFLEVISSKVPYDDIYSSMCNRALDQKISQDGIESIVIEGINQFNYIKRIIQKSNTEVFEILKTYEPFDNEEIFNLIKERIENAR